MKLVTKIKRYVAAALMMSSLVIIGGAISYECRSNIQEYMGETPPPVIMEVPVVVEKNYSKTVKIAIYIDGTIEFIDDAVEPESAGLQYIIEISYDPDDDGKDGYYVCPVLGFDDGSYRTCKLPVFGTNFRVKTERFKVDPKYFPPQENSGF